MKKENNFKIYFFMFLGIIILMCGAFGLDYLDNQYCLTGDLKYSIFSIIGSSLLFTLIYFSFIMIFLRLFIETAKENNDKSFLNKLYIFSFSIFLIIFLIILCNDVGIKDYKTLESKGSIQFIINQYKDIKNEETITITSNDISIVEKTKHIRGSKGSSGSTSYYRYLKIGNDYLIPITDNQSFFIEFLIDDDKETQGYTDWESYNNITLSDYEILMHKESGRIISINGISMFFDDLSSKKEEFISLKKDKNYTSNLTFKVDESKTSCRIDLNDLTSYLLDIQNKGDLIFSMVNYQGQTMLGISLRENYFEYDIAEEKDIYIMFLSNGYSEIYSNFIVLCVNDSKIIDYYISSSLGNKENIRKAVEDFKEIYTFY